jgi:hypothetical protein
MHLGVKTVPFVPHNLIPVLKRPVSFLKFQTIPRRLLYVQEKKPRENPRLSVGYIRKYLNINIYIYVYVCVCVCVCYDLHYDCKVFLPLYVSLRMKLNESKLVGKITIKIIGNLVSNKFLMNSKYSYEVHHM